MALDTVTASIMLPKSSINQNRYDNATIFGIIAIILTTTDSTSHKTPAEYE